MNNYDLMSLAYQLCLTHVVDDNKIIVSNLGGKTFKSNITQNLEKYNGKLFLF